MLLSLTGRIDNLGASSTDNRWLGCKPREANVAGKMNADWKVM